MATATNDELRLPPGPRIPSAVQGIGFVGARIKMLAAFRRHYGPVFSINVPLIGKTVVISDPNLIKDLFTTSSDLVGVVNNNFASIIGPGSTFGLDGEEHLKRRKLLTPPFHGKQMRSYESVVEEETLREIATWPEDREFKMLEPMERLTLNVILRTVFGAEGPALEELRQLLPAAVAIGSPFALLPPKARRDLGPWKPWQKFLDYRRRYDEIVGSLIADARTDPDSDARTDVLSLLLKARYEDGGAISDGHIADELLTLLTAGHETTATALTWAIERLRRHPRLLARLTEEVDDGGSELRHATILEVQRIRPGIDSAIRGTKKRIRLGEWVIPENHTLMVSFPLVHEWADNYPDPASFNPDRFLGANPDARTFVPFGGGIRRCTGAAFASMEMDVVLRTLLRELHFEPTDAPDERRALHGVVIAPGNGGRAVIRRRAGAAAFAVDEQAGKRAG
ncbi:cytochrome P450 [Mycolicibacterium moriokaense]|nr:cytochrome P450 [Mycolicibacterium moriokaense]